jgi:hypothetical protein
LSDAAINTCANHPGVETNLRCNNCGKFICAKCAVRTPTGYRCRECLRGQQKTFETAQTGDYFIAFVVAAVVSAGGGFLVSLISSFSGFFTLILTMLIAPAAGGLVAQVVRSATGKRRSLLMFRLAAAGTLIGGLPFVVRPLLALLTGNIGALFALLWPLIYVAFATSTAYYRLSGIQIGRR